MVYGYERGPGSGRRGGFGFGFRGSSPPWPYFGRGRGGLPRCSYPVLRRIGGAGFRYAVQEETAYRTDSDVEDERQLTREKADLIGNRLEDIEHRLQELEKKE